MREILHVSDIHFGPYHQPRVARALIDLIENRRPALLVVSGDLTQRAKPRQFRQAKDYLDAVPVPVLAVPGNHDVPLYRVWERVFTPYGAYRHHFSEELEPVYRDSEMVVVGVNTAFNWTFKGGRIRASQLARAVREFEQSDGMSFKVAVLHHPLVPAPRFGDQKVVLNADETVERLTAAGVDLVLSGHLHQAYAGWSKEYYSDGDGEMVLVQSGTSSSSRGRGRERGRNSANWLTLEADKITVSHLFFDAAKGRFFEHRRQVFGRGPAVLETT